MFRKFLNDIRGNFAMLTGIAMVPLLGGLAIAVDYVDMSRQRQDTLNALDATGMAAARRLLEGASEADVKAYAREFYEANLGTVRPEKTTLIVELPNRTGGGGRIKLQAITDYDPHFLPPFLMLLNGDRAAGEKKWTFRADAEVQLRNTVEVALVLDNSGSMAYNGKGTGKPRLTLLKSAATELVERLALAGQMMRDIPQPVQFSVVPFASSVNIGADSWSEAWMDREGLSPIHHENFDWATMTGNKQVRQDTPGVGPYRKKGDGWPLAERDSIVTRMTLYDRVNTKWKGCVEARPFPYNTDDTLPSEGDPATLYVPMFAPDETSSPSNNNNNWLSDRVNSNPDPGPMYRQRYMPKYFNPSGDGADANASCDTTAITPLTDVTKTAGLDKIKKAINDMRADGATNVPEGMAWGWRTLSSQAPFATGRPEIERGNDKVVIVLTDGANTYYTPGYFNQRDSAGNKSTYSAYGYAQLANGKHGRIFDGTTLKRETPQSGDYTEVNYTSAMNQHFKKLCVNANGGEDSLTTGKFGAGLIVMTVALDLDSTKTAEKGQISILRECASYSRYSRDPADPSKPKKLFWNASGSNLQDVFREIADELSNLRIVM